MTGLGNYSRLVIESLAREFPADRLTVYTPVMSENPRLSEILKCGNVDFRAPQGAWRHFKALWRTEGISTLLTSDGIEIYHGLSNELPLNIKASGIPSVVTVHDLIYRRMPSCYKPVDRLLYDFKYHAACRNADRIIAVSRRTALDITEIYGIPEERIDIVYQGCDDSFKAAVCKERIAAVKRLYRLPARYLLQVGTVEKRKNLELSLRALSAVPDDIHLVAVGRGKDYLQQMKRLAEELGVASRVHFRHNIPFVDLPALNQGAEIILYPSHYEGFGIPVLEGLESRRPVIAATGSCLEEAGGDAALYVDPHNPRQLSEAICMILNNRELQQRMTNAGILHALKFSNADVASDTRRVYEKVIQARRGR